jgi:DNA-binding NarL/FixJ family response regulator
VDEKVYTMCLFAELTNREREVLDLLVDGKSYREIASLLYISHKTVESHVGHIYQKMGVSNKTQAAVYAVKHGIAEKIR